MRLDLFLKLSRLVPRRTLAHDLCEKGLIFVNGGAAKPSKEIRNGDEIVIRRRISVTTFVVLDVPAKKQLSKEEAASIVRLIRTEPIENDLLS